MSAIRLTAAAAFTFAFLASNPLLAQTATGEPGMAPDQRKAIESVIKDYLLKNPAILRQAMQALQVQEDAQKQKRATAALKKHRSELFQDPGSPVGGNPAGDVTVVEFFDYNCGYCKKVAPALISLITRDPNVRVIFKEFPILGDQSFVGARAALAAQRQGKYIEFHQLLMAAEQADDATIKALAEKAGLNHATLLKDMADPALGELLDRNYKLAAALEINGTPAFIVGDQMIPGAVDVESLIAMVGAERARRAHAKGAKQDGKVAAKKQ